MFQKQLFFKITVSWDVTPCSLIYKNSCYSAAYCLTPKRLAKRFSKSPANSQLSARRHIPLDRRRLSRQP